MYTQYVHCSVQCSFFSFKNDEFDEEEDPETSYTLQHTAQSNNTVTKNKKAKNKNDRIEKLVLKY